MKNRKIRFYDLVEQDHGVFNFSLFLSLMVKQITIEKEEQQNAD